MFENILDVIKQEIRTEATKGDMDLMKLSGLINMANHIYRYTGETVGEVLPAYGPPTFQATAPAIRRPSSEERMTDIVEEMLKQQTMRSNLDDMVSSFVKLRDIEPELADRLKTLIENTISQQEKKTKEVTDASAHPDISG